MITLQPKTMYVPPPPLLSMFINNNTIFKDESSSKSTWEVIEGKIGRRRNNM